MKHIALTAATAFTLLTSTPAFADFWGGGAGGPIVGSPTIPHIDGEKVAAFYTCLFTGVCADEAEE
jgi:hypothetical protein|tara:strand:+ start:313 stop:510 length:198 start_codon:yes stop_codon:yes gene_type:complete